MSHCQCPPHMETKWRFASEVVARSFLFFRRSRIVNFRVFSPVNVSPTRNNCYVYQRIEFKLLINQRKNYYRWIGVTCVMCMLYVCVIKCETNSLSILSNFAVKWIECLRNGMRPFHWHILFSLMRIGAIVSVYKRISTGTATEQLIQRKMPIILLLLFRTSGNVRLVSIPIIKRNNARHSIALSAPHNS